MSSTSASFGTGFIKVGLVPELASTRLLAERLGPGRARSLALSGDLWSAVDAASYGLVDHLAEPAALLDEAVGLAARIAANPALQLAWTKQLLTVNAVEKDYKLIQERESALLRECWASPEHAEAVKAFSERRPPSFPRRPAA